MKVLWCYSHLVWLVFLGFHPYMHLFSFRKLFCDLFYHPLLYSLSDNGIGDKGAAVLADVLKVNQSLTTLK